MLRKLNAVKREVKELKVVPILAGALISEKVASYAERKGIEVYEN